MSAFHPALTGILYGALAQHEQAFIQMQLAASIAQADVDGEVAERYTAVINGLKRMIAIAEPPERGSSALETSEKVMRSYVLLGSLIPQIPEFDIWSWDVRPNEISANYRTSREPSHDTTRAGLREIANRLSIEYVEKRHGLTSPKLNVAATGEINGVLVDIWALIEAERPFCDTHHVMVDADGVCQTCRATEPSFCTIHDSGPIAPGAKCSMCVDLSEPAEAPVHAGDHLADADEYDPDDPDDDPSVYTDAQLHGEACSECGEEFAAGDVAVLAGVVLDGGGAVVDDGSLLAHPDCLTSSNNIEPPGDAP